MDRPHPGADARVIAVAGIRQRAHAYAASTGPGYETLYAHPLVVRIEGKRLSSVRFQCEQRACRFALSDQGNEVHRIDTRTYDVDVKDARAEVTLTLGTDTVPGHYTVSARPIIGKRIVRGSAARFDLTTE